MTREVHNVQKRIVYTKLDIYVFIKIYMIYSFDKRFCISEYSQSRNDIMPASCISTLYGIDDTPNNKNGLK